MYTHEFENVNECDSTHTINLLVNYSDSTFSDTTVCDAFVWDGDTLTVSNSYTKLYSNANGCDSTHTYNLTVNESTSGTDVQESCDEFTWIDGITYTESTDSATFVLINSVGCDSTVILDLTINYSDSTFSNITVCDAFVWDSITYTESGIYTNSYINSFSCDSTHTLVLTVDETTYGVDEIIECDEFTWIDGLTYTESTDSAMFTLTNAEGCDSIITLNLTILESTSSLSEVSECYSYTWNDSTYTQSGTYIFETTGQNGCDSIATLELTINNSTSGVDVQESCDDFTWIDGITYTESTDSATFVLINSVGCDSTVTLDLTINYSDSTFESFTACDSYSWNGINCIASGMYYYTTSNSLGCDSTVTLDLTIINSSSSISDVIACDSYFWNNELYTESGTYTVNTFNVEGCDSTATLNLTINGPSTSTDYVSTCEAYQWNGEVYFESGTYTYNSIDIFGCDSIATLELEVCTLEELIIDGFNSVDTESSVTYSVQENLGSSYFWTISNLGFISSGQFTNEIIVDWSIIEGNSTICVTESRDCFGLDCEGDTYCTNIEVKDVVGIEDISSDFIEIYPNPTRGIFNVSIQLNNLQNVSLELVNSLGELVSDKNLGESKGELNESFDLSNQPSGIYLLRILLDDKVITRKVTLN